MIAMAYRFQDYLGRDHSRQECSGATLYRGVAKSRTENDLSLKRWYFSRAIDHSKGTCEAELFKTAPERSREHELLALGGEDLDSLDLASKEFIETVDRHYTGLVYINSWSYDRAEALEFPYGWARDDRAIVSVSESGLAHCFLDCLVRWNDRQSSENEMTRPDGSLNCDWEPRSIKYAYGKMDYRERAACTLEAPFRLGRAMRLPKGSQDGDLQEEVEWRIALDISDVPSEVAVARLAQVGLLPRSMASLGVSLGAEALEPMILLNGAAGLWLNDFRLSEASGFHFEAL